jgi:glycosyltransferase involved in cell wall biosynthesis
MKICVVHNFYQSSSPSGEDEVFWNEVELLKKNGIDVVTYEKNNDDIATSADRFRTAFETVWSRQTYKELKALLKRERPDIVHFHNIWYLISPAAYSACRDAGVPVVQTLHNFRFFCTNALLMKNGKACEKCIGKIPWRGAVYGCYRGSRLHSVPIAFTESIHKLIGTWNDKIDAFIALTEFSKKKFVECGLPEEKIFVKPNFLANPPDPKYSHQDYAVFLGRLSVEKGLNVLINAFQDLSTMNYELSAMSYQPFHLKIIGDGPLRGQLEEKVKAEKIHNIEFSGRKNFDECMNLLARAQFMVMPAICYENFPMAIREAFACGKPVIASNLGAMAELVQDRRTGLLFEPGNHEDLAEKITWMVEHENECIEMGKNARKVFEQKYTTEKNLEILINIYNKATLKPPPTRWK